MEGNKILLTGAGFSHNFKLPLARHVWAMIFNDPSIQKTSSIRTQMLQNHDYESLYTKILAKQNSDNERQVFLEQINKVFNGIFEKLCTEAFLKKSEFGVSFSDLRNFVKHFRRSRQGFLFTLNQDLFLERLFLGSTINLSCPFIGNPLTNINPTNSSKEKLFARNIPYIHLHNYSSSWKGQDCITPSEKELTQRKNEFEKRSYDAIDYFKIHGSIGWKDTENKTPLVMGTHKNSMITNIPLLNEYLERFKLALATPNSSILIIGYSFSDAHINTCIFDAIDNHGLKLHILNPMPLTEFKKGLKSVRE